MNSSYLILKVLHILSATVLFGTGLGTAFSMWRANRSGDVRVIAGVARSVVLADWCFTTPAIIIQPLTGVMLATLVGFPLRSPWIVASIVLYCLAGACWWPVVWLQQQMYREARGAVLANRRISDRYRRHFRLWFALGWPAFLSVVAIFAIMVFKRIPGP